MDAYFGKVIRKARKEHRCSESGYVIKAGERYVVHSGVCDGFYSFKMALAISDMYERYNDHSWKVNGEGTAQGSLYEEIFNDLSDEQSLKDAILYYSMVDPKMPWMEKAINEARSNLICKR